MNEENVKNELKDFFGQQPIFFIKFVSKEEYAEDIVNGKLFMNKVSYYRKLEEESKKKGQGDSGELKNKIQGFDGILTSQDGSISIPIKGNIDFEFNEDKDTPIFCLMGIKVDDLEISEYNDDYAKLIFRYDRKEIENLKKDFGEYAVIISPTKLEENISKSLDQADKNWIFGEVRYRGINDFERIQAFSKQDATRFLYKDKYFEYQKEYRLVIDESIEDTKIIEIGELKDATILKKVDSLEKGLSFEIKFKE